jgi:hypothetical protein
MDEVVFPEKILSFTFPGRSITSEMLPDGCQDRDKGGRSMKLIINFHLEERLRMH